LEWPSVESVVTVADHIRLTREEALVVEEYDRAYLLDWWADMLYRFRRRLDGPQEPTGGLACQYCAKRRDCPAAIEPWKGMLADADEAEALFGVQLRLAESKKLVGEQLRAYFADRQPVQWRGFDVGFLRPLTPTFVASDPIAIVAAMDGWGLNGREALFTAIDKTKVPRGVQHKLVEAGVARWDRGRPTFKHRKAGVKAEEAGDVA
jgi:hypothetical protein